MSGADAQVAELRQGEIEKLKAENDKLRAKNSQLRAENDELISYRQQAEPLLEEYVAGQNF
jgi:cell division protein FtsB